MTPERWKRARALFDAALDRQPDEATVWLRQECGEDHDLCAEVRRMLEEHQRTGALDRPIWSPPASPAGPPQLWSPGQLIAERYRIIRFLNRGGMGEVYEAQHQLLPDHVALKTLLPVIASDAAMIARFKQEIQLARRIAHPNVCRVFDLEVHPGESPVYFLTMEFLPGETLSAYLARHGAVTTTVALPILRQMVSALEAAHHAGIIHRDLKPSNVMLAGAEPNVRVVITDFGLARSFHTEGETTATLTGAIAGTIDYMAPELLAGEPASVRSDIYALGMVAYRMVTGTLPYVGSTPLSAAFQRANRPVPSPKLTAPELDPVWERTILRALEAEPSGRFSSVTEFLSSLNGEAVAPPARAITRRRIALVAATAGTAVLGGLGWTFRGWTRNKLTPEAERLYLQGIDNIQAGAYFAATKALEQVVRLAPHFSPAHARLAESWLELDITEKATREFLVVRREDNSSLPAVDRLRFEAIDLTLTREFAAAVAKYQTIRERAGAETWGADIDLGRACEKARLFDRAIEAYRRAAEGPAHLAAAWLRLAVLYSKRRRLEDSDKAFEQADARYRQASNLEGLTELTLQRGVEANRAARYDEATTLLLKASSQAHDTGNLQQEISAGLSLANVAYATGDQAKAEARAREALALAQANQMESLSIRGLIALGQAQQGRNDFTGARRYFEDALTLSRRTGSMQLAAQSNLNLASVFDRLDQPTELIQAAKAALDYYQSNRWVAETVSSLTLIGRAEQHRGNYAAARESFRKLLEEATKAGNKPGILLAEEGLGDVLAAMDDYPHALDHYQRTLALSADALRIGYAARNCARILTRLGRFEEASAEFARAEHAALTVPGLRPSVARLRAEMALTGGHAGEAASAARAGLKLENLSPLVAADLTRILGLSLLRSGDRSAGLRNCEVAWQAAQKTGDPDEVVEFGVAMLAALQTTRDAVKAQQVFRVLEPTLPAHPEHKWRAEALMARHDGARKSQAEASLSALGTLWGAPHVQTYLKRPDLLDLGKTLRTTGISG